MKQHCFVIQQVEYGFGGYKECSKSCAFWTYEGANGCRLGAANGSGHPTENCPGDGVYPLGERLKKEE